MHILFLTDNFPPEVNAPASRTFEHCREWVAAGHQVTVITCAPNFPKGEVYPGYKNRLWQQEVMDGIQVIRVWTYITANAGLVKRILDYQSFMVGAIIAAPLVRRVDIVVGTSPQLFATGAAYVVSRLKRVPYVFELRDLWPESIRAVGAIQHSRVLDFLERVELFLYRKAARIVSVTRSFRENLGQRGIDTGKINVVTNGVDTQRFRPMAKDNELARELGIENAFVAGYVGTHGMAHALDTLLDAAAILQNNPAAQDIRLVLIGDGANKAALVARAKSECLDNVIFVDSVPKAEVTRYLSLLDVAIIHLRRTDLFKSVIPSKLFECMGMGIPVLHGVEGESADIVTQSECGQLFEPENAEALASALPALRASPARMDCYRRCGISAAARYDRRSLALEMLAVLERVAGDCGRRSSAPD